ncbi:MAG: NAD-dependent epimerase/dehydratase family protein [Thermoanaerobaculum sp.]
MRSPHEPGRRSGGFVAITGANGYIGSALVAAAVEKGCRVLALSRKPVSVPVGVWMAYDLRGAPPELPEDTQAVVHLAADVEGRERSEEEEVEAAKALASAAEKVGARFIFVSSLSASPKAPRRYGRVKWAIERELLPRGHVVVRPGLVYGGSRPGGLYAQLLQFLQKSPAYPWFFPPLMVRLIHVEELVEAILKLSVLPRAPLGLVPDIGGRTVEELAKVLRRPELVPRPGVYPLAGPPVAFSRVLQMMARYRLRRCLIPIPVPTGPFLAVLRLAGAFFPRLGDMERRLRSLRESGTASASCHTQLEVSLRDPVDGLHPSGSGRRRQLLLEGFFLLRYIFSTRPPVFFLRVYVRGVEEALGGKPLGKPWWVGPGWRLLPLLDLASRHLANLAPWRTRLEVALRVGECHPALFQHLVVTKARHRWAVTLEMLFALTLEAFKRAAYLATRFCLALTNSRRVR